MLLRSEHCCHVLACKPGLLLWVCTSRNKILWPFNIWVRYITASWRTSRQEVNCSSGTAEITAKNSESLRILNYHPGKFIAIQVCSGVGWVLWTLFTGTGHFFPLFFIFKFHFWEKYTMYHYANLYVTVSHKNLLLKFFLNIFLKKWQFFLRNPIWVLCPTYTPLQRPAIYEK